LRRSNRKRRCPEKVVAKLRQIDDALAKGSLSPKGCGDARAIGRRDAQGRALGHVDFMRNQLHRGQKLRVSTVVGQYTRRVPTTESGGVIARARRGQPVFGVSSEAGRDPSRDREPSSRRASWMRGPFGPGKSSDNAHIGSLGVLFCA
jgi:hypothetical protein